MLERGVSGLPVVDARGHVVGVVSEGDLIRPDEMAERRARWWLDVLAEGAPVHSWHWFQDLWIALHGQQSWLDNPEVVAILFRVVKANIDKITDDNLVLMAAVIDSVVRKYVSEDDLKGKGNGKNGAGGGNGADDAKTKRAQAMELMKTKAYTDAFDPKHDDTVKQVNAIYAELGGGKA